MYRNGSFNGSGKCLYCEDAITNCNECTDNATECTRCDIDFYITYENYTCSNCVGNTTFHNGTNDGYSLCYPCSVAFNNCAVCDYPADKCLLCTEDYFLNENYRCKPFYFIPEYNNAILIENSSLNFSIVNNRRYAILNNPCKYNRSKYSLDFRLHSYWVASTDFELVNNSQFSNIEYLIKSLDKNESDPNYHDPKWTFYGESVFNSLSIPGRNDALYYVKYFCVYGNTFSNETEPGIFNLYFPPNNFKEGNIFLNFHDRFEDNYIASALPTLACALQLVFNLGDTNQIDMNGENSCNMNISSIVINGNNNNSNTNNNHTTNNNNQTLKFMENILYCERNISL